MLVQPSLCIGVDIGLGSIYCSVFDNNGTFLRCKKVLSPVPFIPGSLTVEICDLLSSLKCFGNRNLMGVFFSDVNLFNGASVNWKSISDEWADVPFVNWLELRLNMQVKLLRKEDFFLKKEIDKNLILKSEETFQKSFIAAYLTYEYFNENKVKNLG